MGWKGWFAGVSAVLLAACAAQGGAGALPGGERDAHGCLASAGYVFSHVKNACIRVFEDGVRLHDAGNPHDGLASFAVFGDDGQGAELFLPYVPDRVVLRREGDVWTDGVFVLRRDGEGWVLERVR